MIQATGEEANTSTRTPEACERVLTPNEVLRELKPVGVTERGEIDWI
jgi:hypothetical protein